jgi:NAD(P)-dependent dehydrogenase (short-subunit alcohol dehydrogenase family)
MSFTKKLAIVTGANKGIGYECVRQLRQVLSADYEVLLTSRNEQLGHDAVAALAKSGLQVCL